MSKRVAIYARVSTRKDSQRNSLENQISYAKSIAKENGWSIVGEYVDDGISGSKRDNRAALKQLLEDVKKKKFDIVISKSVTRLGRNTVENLNTAHELETKHIRLILFEDNYDTESRDTRLMFNLKSALAEEDSARLSRAIKYGLKTSAENGNFTSSIPPFGYKSINKKLVIDPDFAPIAKQIFDLYLNKNWGMYRISNYLSDIKVPTPRTVAGAKNAGEVWNQSTIKVILSNIAYTGTLVLHKEEVRDFISQIRREVDKSEQIVHHNSHEAIISRATFDAVQLKMKKKGTNKSNGNESLFAHLAICADCGKGMTYRKDRRKASGGAYVCTSYVKRSSKVCSSHILGYHELLSTVKKDIQELMSNNIKLETLYGVLTSKKDSYMSQSTKELKQISKRLNRSQNAFQSILQLYTDNEISIEQFRVQNQIIQDEQQQLKARQAELESSLSTEKDTKEQIEQFKNQISRFAKLDIDNESILKQVLHTLIDKIEIDNDETIKCIHYNISLPKYENSQEKRGA